MSAPASPSPAPSVTIFMGAPTRGEVLHALKQPPQGRSNLDYTRLHQPVLRWKSVTSTLQPERLPILPQHQQHRLVPGPSLPFASNDPTVSASSFLGIDARRRQSCPPRPSPLLVAAPSPSPEKQRESATFSISTHTHTSSASKPTVMVGGSLSLEKPGPSSGRRETRNRGPEWTSFSGSTRGSESQQQQRQGQGQVRSTGDGAKGFLSVVREEDVYVDVSNYWTQPGQKTHDESRLLAAASLFDRSMSRIEQTPWPDTTVQTARTTTITKATDTAADETVYSDISLDLVAVDEAMLQSSAAWERRAAAAAAPEPGGNASQSQASQSLPSPFLKPERHCRTSGRLQVLRPPPPPPPPPPTQSTSSADNARRSGDAGEAESSTTQDDGSFRGKRRKVVEEEGEDASLLPDLIEAQLSLRRSQTRSQTRSRVLTVASQQQDTYDETSVSSLDFSFLPTQPPSNPGNTSTTPTLGTTHPLIRVNHLTPLLTAYSTPLADLPATVSLLVVITSVELTSFSMPDGETYTRGILGVTDGRTTGEVSSWGDVAMEWCYGEGRVGMLRRRDVVLFERIKLFAQKPSAGGSAKGSGAQQRRRPAQPALQTTTASTFRVYYRCSEPRMAEEQEGHRSGEWERTHVDLTFANSDLGIGRVRRLKEMIEKGEVGGG